MEIEYSGEPLIRIGIRDYKPAQRMPYSEALQTYPDIAQYIQHAVERYKKESKDPKLARAYPVSPRELSEIPRDERIIYVQEVHLNNHVRGEKRKHLGIPWERRWGVW